MRPQWYATAGLLIVTAIAIWLVVDGGRDTFYSQWPCHIIHAPHLLCSNYILAGAVYVHSDYTVGKGEGMAIPVYCIDKNKDKDKECKECRSIYNVNRSLQCCNNTRWANIGIKECGKDIAVSFIIGISLLLIVAAGLSVVVPQLMVRESPEQQLWDRYQEVSTEYAAI